jgi:hypothetical protein
MEVIKKFVYNASTSSLSEREILFKDLFDVLNDKTGKIFIVNNFHFIN